MNGALRFVICAGLTFGLLTAASVAADRRIAIADPYYGMLLEGRVLDERGTPLEGVELTRMSDASGTEVYNRGFFRRTTDAEGRFEFSRSGIGTSTGRTWHLRAQRADCVSTMVTVLLEAGEYRSRDADVKTGVEIRLRCSTSPR